MGRARFSFKLLLALVAGFGIGAGLGWINGQGDQRVSAPPFRISGMVDIRPELRARLKPTDVLFIIAAEPGHSRPYAVTRVAPVSLPYAYTLGPENRMMATAAASGNRFVVSARIDRDGQANALQPGDLVSQSAAGPVPSPADSVNVLIDTAVQ